MIYIVDYLGIHCGMHYYLGAFKKVLNNNDDNRVTILANYTDVESGTPFFKNQYVGNKMSKGLSLLINLMRLKRFVDRHPNDIFIFLTYGNAIDIPFLKIISQVKGHVIDIHEAIAQNVDTNMSLKEKLKKLYSKKILAVISHSERTDNFLDEYCYRGIKFKVPHFKYIFPKKYNKENIADEVFDAPDKNKINILFFGNLNESKGVDILLESLNLLDPPVVDKLNVIIAGKDFDGSVNRIRIKDDRKVTIIKRHISDDELTYLYQNVDYVSLPYRKTSQSGILEMSFYFKRPIIASDIPYFRKTLDEFKSFGIIAGNSPEEYARCMSGITQKCPDDFFSDDEYSKYENRKEVDEFKIQFNNWINGR